MASNGEKVQIHARENGVEVDGADIRGESHPGVALIPWEQAVAVARQIIQLARNHSDVT
jgi:hypothetical protein